MFVTPFQAGCRCLKLQLEGGIEEEEKEKDRKRWQHVTVEYDPTVTA